MLAPKILALALFLCFMIIVSKKCTDDQVNDYLWPPPYNYYLNNTENFTVIELDNSSDARCSDGSIYKFYYIPGQGNGSKKFMFFFPGGGYCGDDNTDMLENCLIRMPTFEGSSSSAGSNGSTFTVGYSLGYFSSDQHINPLFWNWHKIYLPYCDGILFQGYRKDPYVYNGTEIWFRGYNNTLSTFEYVRENYNLFDAEEVLIAGISAGGQAIFMWMNYFQKYFPSTMKLSGLTDAGLFLDNINQNSKCHLFRAQMKAIANYTGSIHLDIFYDCKYKDTKFYKCMIPEYIAEFIDVPMFIINSQNDWQALRGAYGLHCLDHGIQNCPDSVNRKITKFRETFLKVAMKLKELKPKWGFWLRRCLEHYYGNSIAWIGNLTVFSAESYTDKNIRGAFYEWYQDAGKAAAYIDLANYQMDCQLINDSQ